MHVCVFVCQQLCEVRYSITLNNIHNLVSSTGLIVWQSVYGGINTEILRTKKKKKKKRKIKKKKMKEKKMSKKKNMQ